MLNFYIFYIGYGNSLQVCPPKESIVFLNNLDEPLPKIEGGNWEDYHHLYKEYTHTLYFILYPRNGNFLFQ